MYGKHIYALQDAKLALLRRFLGRAEARNSLNDLILRVGTEEVIRFDCVWVSLVLSFLEVAVLPEAKGSFCQDGKEVKVALKYLKPDLLALYKLTRLEYDDPCLHLKYLTAVLRDDNETSD